MSSVAAWLSTEPIPLAQLRDCFIEMREELPNELHYGKVGSQFTVLFEPDIKVVPETIRQNVKDKSLQVIVEAIRFADRLFIQIRVQQPLDKKMDEVFNGLGLSNIASGLVLAEQTTADVYNDVLLEPGFAVENNVAFAACGGISLLMQQFSAGSKIRKSTSGSVAKRGEVAVLASWFSSILSKETGPDRYKKLLELTPTYLFSILFERTKDDLFIVGLRQNEMENGDRSDLNHLYYIHGKDKVMMARTKSGLASLANGVTTESIQAINNKEPVSFSLRKLQKA